nr:helix-turn-helix domain-containing protein [Kribbella italica]
MSAQELADYLGVTIETLRNWRRHDQGPAFLRIGIRIWYKRAEVAAWIEASTK